jgi:GTP-binding protein
MLAFLIPVDSLDWQAEYDQLRTEIRSYSAPLAEKPHCVVITKLDLLGEEFTPELRTDGAIAVYSISAPGRMGLQRMIDDWWKHLQRLR